MKNRISKCMDYIKRYIIWSRLKREGHVPIMGSEQIKLRGHRKYVGAKWEVLGNLQFDFLKEQGLNPDHVLYDIGCGALRAGVHFIPYLNATNYCGMDREYDLIKSGIDSELGVKMFNEKKPEFVESANFEFNKFSKKPDYCIAQSLFTHLTLSDIRKCLQNLKNVTSGPCKFYATFDEEGKTPISKKREGLPNPPWSHSNLTFYYSQQDMAACANKTGWNFEYIGDWGHPAHQQMILFWL